METLFWILISAGAFLCACYFLLIAAYCIGWIRTEQPEAFKDSSVFISVIIAARNEEAVISECLTAIIHQTYPSDKFEVIIADDHSEDATKELVRIFSQSHSNIRLLPLSSDETGKKAAIRSAIEIAKGDLIVTADADCVMGKSWLSAIAAFYKQTNAKMIVGPVAFHKERTVFEKMQSLEFMALMACGAASLYYKKAILCNGANLAYTREAYRAVYGFDGIDEKASGDDVLLMYKINTLYPGEVRFLKNKEAIVFTKAKKTLKEFISQRKRWASKSFSVFNMETKAVSLIVYAFNLFLVLLPLIDLVYYRNSIFYPVLSVFCLILTGIKCIIDFLLLFLSASFFQKERFLLFFLPEQILYIFYVVLMGMIGSLGKYEWKGRKIN